MVRETRCPGMRVDGRAPAGVLCEGLLYLYECMDALGQSRVAPVGLVV